MSTIDLAAPVCLSKISTPVARTAFCAFSKATTRRMDSRKAVPDDDASMFALRSKPTEMRVSDSDVPNCAPLAAAFDSAPWKSLVAKFVNCVMRRSLFVTSVAFSALSP